MKHFTIIIFLLASISIFAQNTYVPDDNFEQALIDLGYDTGALDDYVPTVNISGITYLDVGTKSISNLTGIEDFIALTELNCSFNQLTSLDVLVNTDLNRLDCADNQLTSLDISTNTALTELTCSSNQLTSIDVSKNTALSILWCDANQLTSLDVSSNTALTYLFCGENQLTNLDVSANTELINLHCYSNHLTSLDVSTNTALIGLYCLSNQLINLDIRNGNNVNIIDFRTNNNPNLNCIYVDDATWSEANWTNIDPTSTFVETEEECGYLNDLTYVPDDNFEQALINLGADPGELDDFVPTPNISWRSSLSVSEKNISDLTGIKDFTSLTNLYCYSNQLTNLDLSENNSLDILYCNDNQLESLNVKNGNNSNIVEFYSENNPNLNCIIIDDKESDYLSGWTIDASSTFVETEVECDGLAVDDIIQNSDFTIHPNPAKEKFSIETSSEIESVKIYDIFGKLLKAYDKQGIYSVSDLASGVYLIHIKNKTGVQILKIIIE